MKNENIDCSTGKARIFKFNHPIAATIVLTMIRLMLLFFAIAQMIAKNYLGSFVCFCGLLLFIFVWLINIVVTSDIIIDDTGIARATFGKIWQKIAWNDVQYIRIFEDYDRRSKNFNLYPISKPKPRLLINEKMAFTDKMERPAEFNKLINFYILSNNIKIESVTGGVKTYPTQL